MPLFATILPRVSSSVSSTPERGPPPILNSDIIRNDGSEHFGQRQHSALGLDELAWKIISNLRLHPSQ